MSEIEARLDVLIRNATAQHLATTTPDGSAGAVLDDATAVPEMLTDAGLIDAMVAWQRQVAFGQARQAQLLAEFARRRPDTGHGERFDGYAADEVGWR